MCGSTGVHTWSIFRTPAYGVGGLGGVCVVVVVVVVVMVEGDHFCQDTVAQQCNSSICTPISQYVLSLLHYTALFLLAVLEWRRAPSHFVSFRGTAAATRQPQRPGSNDLGPKT